MEPEGDSVRGVTGKAMIQGMAVSLACSAAWFEVVTVSLKMWIPSKGPIAA